MQDIDDGRCERGRIESKTASEKSALHELQQHINGLKESLNSVERRFDDLQGDDESASISEMVFRCGGMEKSQVVQSLSVAYSCFCTNLTRQFALQEIQIQIVAAIYLNQFLVSSVCQTPICQPSRFDGQNRCRNAIKCFFYLFSRFGRNATVNIQLAVTWTDQKSSGKTDWFGCQNASANDFGSHDKSDNPSPKWVPWNDQQRLAGKWIRIEDSIGMNGWTSSTQ